MLILISVLFLIAPVNMTLTWDHGLTVCLRIWGLGRTWPVKASPSGQSIPRQQIMRLLGAWLRTGKVRRFLLQHVHLLRLQALLHLGLNSADRTAVLAVLLQQAARLLPSRTDIRIQPEFLSSTRLQARCILFFHLGTILITAAMLLTAYLLEAREHPAPHPREA